MKTLNLVVWLLTLVMAAGIANAATADSLAQERIAYLELSRLRALSMPGVSYEAYRGAVANAREKVKLLQNQSSTGTRVLKDAFGMYERALSAWRLQADSNSPVDSLRTDEPDGSAVIAQCPGIRTFHNRERDRVWVRDAVACFWYKASAILDTVPAGLR